MHTENNGPDNGARDHKGRFGPGNPGKPEGSTKNKLRDEIKSFLNDNWKDFPTWFAALKPKEKIQTMLDLLPYAVSRLQTVSVDMEDGSPPPITGMVIENFIPPQIDYTKLSEQALKEVLAATTVK